MTGAERFIELMGRHIEEEGGPRIAGRLMAVLLLSRDPLSLDDLVERLQVSKASVSTNVRMLELRGVAEKVTIAGDRRDFYQTSWNARDRMIQQMVERARLMTERLEVGLAAVRDEEPEVRERFESLISFVGRACRELECRLEQDFSSGAGEAGSRSHEANVR
ncbi:MAG: hypothetical protein LBG44_02460 [Gemmatimonadota bacterium]|jgi:DNA-binding transcriptional regulator GbsR (MarR family)|nr:hypothetical protein [Gemmatimonadota bacterium]